MNIKNLDTLSLIILKLFIILISISFTNQTAYSSENQDGWLHYGKDPGGARHSNLTQINPENVKELKLAWSYRHGDLERHPDRKGFAGFHTTPILLPKAAGESLVGCTPFSRVFALDPENGAERWHYDPNIELSEIPSRLKCLGVAYFEDLLTPQSSACRHRIIWGTHDRRIVAVDAITGEVCKSFGNNGEVDVNPIISASSPSQPDPAGTTFSAAPVIVNGVIVIGHINNMKNQFPDAPAGMVRAFDARSGSLKWQFDPLPRNRDEMHASDWTDEAMQLTGGANAWPPLSADPSRDLVFIPTAGPGPNFYGGTRPGDNRWANSVVAIRVKSGEMAWGFQVVHHDVWDWDIPSAPIVADIPIDGKVIPALIVLTKQSLVFVLNRDTGKPIYDVEERAVPTDGVPGEILSPTQPFPVKPPPLMQTSIGPEDAWGITFNDKSACKKVIEQSTYGDIFTPPSREGWIMYPSTGGGPNWGGGAWDPKNNLLVTNISQVAMWLQLLPNSSAPEAPIGDYSAGAPMGPAAKINNTDYAIYQKIILSPQFMPCTKPPWSTLVAVDLAKGEIAWTQALGTIEELSPLP
ncbi:MAG: pyrroloquinoline quinone-dependent dehydrogenase [Pseudomonadota bacterium]|nr:pyrroloquinoline quinone-dependent dehydrogenase [Pseudomonadota bacterium]